MLPFHKILCPTDCSGGACPALDTTIQLAKDFHAELSVLLVVVPAFNELGVAAYSGAGYAPIIPCDTVELDDENMSVAKIRLAVLGVRLGC